MSDKEILKLVSEFRKGILGDREPELMCYAVCLPLEAFLRCSGVAVTLVCGSVELPKIRQHYWLKLKDGRIIDPTASQFKTPEGKEMPEIFFGEKPDWYKSYSSWDLCL